MSKQFTTLHAAVSEYLNLLGYTKQTRCLIFPYVRAIPCILRVGNCKNNVRVYCISINIHFNTNEPYYHSWRAYGINVFGVLQLSWISDHRAKYMHKYIPYLGYDDKS